MHRASFQVMTSASTDEKNRDPELGTPDAESQNIDITPEKSKEEAKDSKDGEEKEKKGSIKDYFVNIFALKVQATSLTQPTANLQIL